MFWFFHTSLCYWNLLENKTSFVPLKRIYVCIKLDLKSIILAILVSIDDPFVFSVENIQVKVSYNCSNIRGNYKVFGVNCPVPTSHQTTITQLSWLVKCQKKLTNMIKNNFNLLPCHEDQNADWKLLELIFVWRKSDLLYLLFLWTRRYLHYIIEYVIKDQLKMSNKEIPNQFVRDFNK